MDYEKKYKEALERARKSYVNSIEQGWTCDKVIYEEIFPELKESEDEKIRKTLIKGFQHYDKECKWGEFTTTEILAWLEKQGETFTKKDVDDAYLKGVCDAKQELEKQCRQESLCDKCKKEQPSHSCQDITELGRCAVEQLGRCVVEQKPAN